MRDARIAKLAEAQHNRVSYAQLSDLGLSQAALVHRLDQGRLVRVADGVYALPPLLDDPWGRWMGATLTAPATYVSRVSASVAWDVLGNEGVVTVVRPGSGGPRLVDGIRVHRSTTLEGNTTTLNGVPITTIERTLLDISTLVVKGLPLRAERP